MRGLLFLIGVLLIVAIVTGVYYGISTRKQHRIPQPQPAPTVSK